MNIETFVQKHGGKYKSYRGGWLIQCPFHDDNSPSCSVSVNGLFNCWGCGAKGNFTRLLHDIAGFSWKKSTEIVSLLDLRKGWTKQAKRIYEQSEKPTISEAVLGLYDVDWFEAFEMYQENGGQNSNRRPPWALVFDKGFTPKTLTHFEAGYDSEDQRITIPIWNYQKKLLGILGRACRSQEFKYVPYLNFKYTDHVYNLHATEIGKPVVLVEGAFDVWMLHQWRIPFTVIATMVAHISQQQVAEILEKHSRINIFYDNDEAGRIGALSAARNLTKHGGKIDIIQTVKGVENIKDMNFYSFMKQFRNRQAFPGDFGEEINPQHKANVPSRRVSS
jgi:DNA primase